MKDKGAKGMEYKSLNTFGIYNLTFFLNMNDEDYNSLII